MKKAMTLLLSILLAIALSACARPADHPQAKSPEPELNPGLTPEPIAPTPAEAAEPAVTNTAVATSPSGELAREWESFQVELNGEIFRLPAHFSAFAAAGWSFEDASQTLTPDSFSSDRLKNEEQVVYARIINFGADELPFSECYISSLSQNQQEAERGAALFFPGGVTIGATMDQVRMIYGDPTSVAETATVISWRYELKPYAYVEIKFDSESKTVNKLEMENFYRAIIPQTE